MTVPTISIVIPAYNHELFVAETIRSIVDQTRQPDELVVVDDASSDGTWAAIQESLRTIPFRSVARQHEKNLGLSRTLNDALSLCQSTYVGLVASDDAYPSNKLELQLAFLEAHPEFGAVYGDLAIMNVEGQHLRVDRPFSRELDVRPGPGFAELSFEAVALGRSGASNQTALFRRSVVTAIGGFDESLMHEDFDFVLRLLRASRAAYLFQPGAHYRAVPSGLNRRFKEFEHEYEIVIEKHRAHLESLGIDWRTVRGVDWLRRANNRLNTDQQLGALYCAARSLINEPRNLAAWKTGARALLPGRFRQTVKRALLRFSH